MKKKQGIIGIYNFIGEKRSALIITVFIITCFTNCQKESDFQHWETYRGDSGANAYSSLSQINRENVGNLKPAWVFHSGDPREGNRSTIECNPIIIGEVIYLTSPQLKLYALNAATGKEIWMFNPYGNEGSRGVNRGVSYWEEGYDKRILFPADNRLYAINAETGKPVPTFGKAGYIDLREGLDRDTSKIYVTATSPGIIYKNRIIIGHGTSETDGAAPGFIRAFDVKTGDLIWTFRTIPQPGEFGYETWKSPDAWKSMGGANVWAGFALDKKQGIVYCPTGSAVPDFYGGYRKGENLFANCLLALNANTGKRLWHFQMVHHDLWDYDLPSTPNLITIKKNGKTVDAVAQITKMGHVFVFDRETGEPFFPVEERKVPLSDVEGEESWPTQPFPVRPPPFVRQIYTKEDLPNISPESRDFAIRKLDSARNEGIFTPLSYKGTIVFPGFRGGAEWSGASFDFETGILYVNANEIPNLVSLRKLPNTASQQTAISPGEKLYQLNCALCHGPELQGREKFPALKDINKRMSAEEMKIILENGKGTMPGFPQLEGGEREAIVAFLEGKTIDVANEQLTAESNQEEMKNPKFVHSGYAQFRDEQGYPAVKPPWGTLNAIDMNKGEILWQKPLGEFPELTEKGIPPTGTQNFGGCLVTAGGLVFIGASADEKFRAFDKTTGEILWEYKLPYGGYATPSTYSVNGTQYMVIAAGGGGKVGTKSGDVYIAFCLSDEH